MIRHQIARILRATADRIELSSGNLDELLERLDGLISR